MNWDDEHELYGEPIFSREENKLFQGIVYALVITGVIAGGIYLLFN